MPRILGRAEPRLTPLSGPDTTNLDSILTDLAVGRGVGNELEESALPSGSLSWLLERFGWWQHR
jgi:hypothetical protein